RWRSPRRVRRMRASRSTTTRRRSSTITRPKAKPSWSVSARRARTLLGVALVHFDAAAELLVLVADELDHFLIGRNALVDAHRERLRVRLRIFHRDVHLQVAVRGPAD